MNTATPENTQWVPVPVPKYSHLYEVSSSGQIRSLDRIVVEQGTGFKRFHKGKIITPKKSGRYWGVSLHDYPNSERFYIHRLVALAFIPNPNDKPCVNHKNRDRYDNRVENLEWVTHQENSQHLVQSPDYVPAQVVRGEAQHSSKLSADIVKELRLSWDKNTPISQLAKQYGVTHRAMYKVLGGISWKHVIPERAVNWPD
jgi:hypothetical protein